MKIRTYTCKKSNILEKIKWLFVLIFFTLSMLIHYYCGEINVFIRILIIFFLILCSIGTAFFTNQGRYILASVNTLKQEIKKITWPKYKETLYTTFIVISVTILISFLLWSLDSIIFHLIAFIISLRF